MLFRSNIDSRSMLVSYNTAPVSQFFVDQGLVVLDSQGKVALGTATVDAQGNITNAVCTCEFLTWGWWSGSVSYTSAGYVQGQSDRFNLATYVAGTMSTVNQLNAANFATSEATYRGHLVGSVKWGDNNYIAAGTYANTWNYGAGQGKA